MSFISTSRKCSRKRFNSPLSCVTGCHRVYVMQQITFEELSIHLKLSVILTDWLGRVGWKVQVRVASCARTQTYQDEIELESFHYFCRVRN